MGVDLSSKQVADADLKRLTGLTELQTLYLTGTKVTDVGLEHLKTLTGMQLLWLTGTTVTPAGMEKLQMALPKCTIYNYKPEP